MPRRWSDAITLVYTLDEWNSLPDHVFDVKSVDEFKAKLNQYWMRKQYAPPPPHDAYTCIKCQDQE